MALSTCQNVDLTIYTTIGIVRCTFDLGIVKGQLISKCPFGVIVWTKIPTKSFPGFLP